jgi:hypothetical protein
MFARIATQTGTPTIKIVELASDGEGGEHDLDIAEHDELVRLL